MSAVPELVAEPEPAEERLAAHLDSGFNLMHPMRGATSVCSAISYLFQSNAPRAGCNSKTIQSKRILVTRRMYSFANYVLRTLKHLSTYCIGTTLQPLIFGAKLPAILC